MIVRVDGLMLKQSHRISLRVMIVHDYCFVLLLSLFLNYIWGCSRPSWLLLRPVTWSCLWNKSCWWIWMVVCWTEKGIKVCEYKLAQILALDVVLDFHLSHQSSCYIISGNQVVNLARKKFYILNLHCTISVTATDIYLKLRV